VANNNDIRRWNCRHCGRANVTLVGLDGTVKCEHCSQTTAIQPSRLPRVPRTAPSPSA
jgi:transcription elongation factor Elf1